MTESIELMTTVKRIQEKNKDLSQVFDVGEYTEMELSHKHDMYHKYEKYGKTQLNQTQKEVLRESSKNVGWRVAAKNMQWKIR